MAKLAYVVICQRALLDQTRNVSLVQVLEELGVAPPPSDPPVPPGAIIPFPACIVTSWKRDKNGRSERAKGRVRLLAPSGKQFARAEFEIDVASAERARCMLELPGIPYHGPGFYVVRIDLASGRRWKAVGETEFKLHHDVTVGSQVKH
jgi:hypothetical protein